MASIVGYLPAVIAYPNGSRRFPFRIENVRLRMRLSVIPAGRREATLGDETLGSNSENNSRAPITIMRRITGKMRLCSTSNQSLLGRQRCAGVVSSYPSSLGVPGFFRSPRAARVQAW